MKVLITGFEPFAQRDENATVALLEWLGEQKVDFELTTRVLPVLYDKAPSILNETVKSLCPDLVLSLGESAKLEFDLHFEVVALNQRHSGSPDNSGVIKTLEPIDNTLSLSLKSQWELRELQRTFRGTALKLSFHAGTYVCNEVFFSLLKNESTLGYRSAFVHIPASPQTAESLARQGKAILQLVDFYKS